MFRLLIAILVSQELAAAQDLTVSYTHDEPTASRAMPDTLGNAARYGVLRTPAGKPYHWDSGCLSLFYDAGSVSQEVANAVDAALATWTTGLAECGSSFMAGAGSIPTPHQQFDGINTVRVLTDRWCRPADANDPEKCFSPWALAVTRSIVDEDGRILDADIYLNAVNFDLGDGDASQDTKPVIDLASVVTHELGHVLGLAHNCGTGEEDAWPKDMDGRDVPSCDDATDRQWSTMYYLISPGETRARVLTTHDIEGACAVLRGTSCQSSVSGGCATAPSTSLSLAALLGFLRRRRRK